MKHSLKINHPDYGELVFYPENDGQIELRKLSDNLTILIIYFDNLILDENCNQDFDNLTGVMLSNFPVNIKELRELDGMTIELKKGWKSEGKEDDMLFTMLNIWDGEPINNNRIQFKLHDNGSFNVHWTGAYGDWEKDADDLELEMTANPAQDIVTPLCEHEEEILKVYDKNGSR